MFFELWHSWSLSDQPSSLKHHQKCPQLQSLVRSHVHLLELQKKGYSHSGLRFKLACPYRQNNIALYMYSTNIILPLRSLSALGAVALLVPLRPAFFTEAPSDEPSATELGEVTRTPANMDN